MGVVFGEPDLEVAAGVFEKSDVFVNEVAAVSPSVGGDDEEVVFGGGIEEGLVGEVVNADGVESGGADLWEVGGG